MSGLTCLLTSWDMMMTSFELCNDAMLQKMHSRHIMRTENGHHTELFLHLFWNGRNSMVQVLLVCKCTKLHNCVSVSMSVSGWSAKIRPCPGSFSRLHKHVSWTGPWNVNWFLQKKYTDKNVLVRNSLVLPPHLCSVHIGWRLRVRLRQHRHNWKRKINLFFVWLCLRTYT